MKSLRKIEDDWHTYMEQWEMSDWTTYMYGTDEELMKLKNDSLKSERLNKMKQLKNGIITLH